MAGRWTRRGVVQFHQPHGIRTQVVDALRAELPDMLEVVRSAGGQVLPAPGSEDVRLGIRRSVYESVFWDAVRADARIEVLPTTARDASYAADGRVTLVTDHGVVTSDLVLNATGRARFLDDRRAPGLDADPGIAYASRQYQVAERGLAAFADGQAVSGTLPGYSVMLFRQDSDVVSTLFVHESADDEFAVIRLPSAYDAVTAAVPALASLMRPESVRPISPVHVGRRMRNVYRGRLTEADEDVTPGVVHVGDAQFSPSPMNGRGMATSLLQARHLIDLVEAGHDVLTMARMFDEWCRAEMLPWFHVQVADDVSLVRQWHGLDLEVDGRLPPSVIAKAHADDEHYRETINHYLDMRLPPSVLIPMEPATRAKLASGWRPPFADGPSRAELLRTARAALT